MMQLHRLINFALFQAVWFLSLLLESGSILFSSLIILLMVYLSKQKKHDVILVLSTLPLALLAELLAVQLGLLTFNSDPIPVWLSLLWVALLLCINTSMVLLSKLKLWLVFVVCCAFAPASYWAGARFEVLGIGVPLAWFWLCYGALWASVFSSIIFINKKIPHWLAH
jgi:hypothetical protein